MKIGIDLADMLSRLPIGVVVTDIEPQTDSLATTKNVPTEPINKEQSGLDSVERKTIRIQQRRDSRTYSSAKTFELRPVGCGAIYEGFERVSSWKFSVLCKRKNEESVIEIYSKRGISRGFTLELYSTPKFTE